MGIPSAQIAQNRMLAASASTFFILSNNTTTEESVQPEEGICLDPTSEELRFFEFNMIKNALLGIYNPINVPNVKPHYNEFTRAQKRELHDIVDNQSEGGFNHKCKALYLVLFSSNPKSDI